MRTTVLPERTSLMICSTEVVEGEDEEGPVLLDNMEVSHRTGSNKGRHTCNV